MTGHDNVDRVLAGWFEADALSPAPTGDLDRVLDATRRRRPRPAWLAGPGSHWVGEAPTAGSSAGVGSLWALGLRWSTAIILLLAIVALVGGAILVGTRLVRPTPPPLGHLGHLAYALDGDVYVADWDGKNPVRITQVPPRDKSDCEVAGYWQPIWSPDGRYLAYRYVAFGCPSAIETVYVSDPNGHFVTSFPGFGYGTASIVAWSPDSSRVAAWLDFERTIGVYGLDGVRQALLNLPPGYGTGRDEDPVWSPDGASLLLSLRGGTDPRRTWELPVDGGTPRPVPADDPRSRLDVAYSPDGARIAFVNEGSLVVAGRDGSQPRTLITGPVVSGEPPFWTLKWSPMGDRIAFAAATGGQTDFGSVSDLRLVDVATGAVTSLRVGAGTDALYLISYSPEGDRILFSRVGASDAQSLWSVRVDGSDARPVVTGTNMGDWQWQPADR